MRKRPFSTSLILAALLALPILALCPFAALVDSPCFWWRMKLAAGDFMLA